MTRPIVIQHPPEKQRYISAVFGLETYAPPEVRKAVSDQVLAECEALGITVFGYGPSEPFSKLVTHKAMLASREIWAKYPQSDIPKLRALGLDALNAWDVTRTREANAARESASIAERKRQMDMIAAAGYFPEPNTQ